MFDGLCLMESENIERILIKFGIEIDRLYIK
jgi:hypothetical protein